MQYSYTYNSPIGEIYITETDGKISYIGYFKEKVTDKIICTSLIKDTINQLEEYFKGKRKDFNIPLLIEGTDFRKIVWKALENIPYGKVCTYIDIAKAVDCPKGARAVGNAIHNNPISIIIPCHRIIGKSGNLTGYAGGIDKKEKLLELEGYKLL